MKIITITLNPAFDIHCYTEHFEPFHENLARVTAREAGGKGVNISRALTVNGVENTALVVLGEDNADDFRRSLAEYGMNVEEIVVNGRIRENITLHTGDSPETRISFAGFDTNDGLLAEVERALDGNIDTDTIVTFTGRVPEGIALSTVKKMLVGMRDKGARIVIDSKSFDIQDIIDCRPWLIKPNDEEIVMYSNAKIDSLKSAADAAENLRALGIENVMISLGAKGAVLACADGRFAVNAPEVEVLSTIGAGDSSIAGFTAAAKAGGSYSDMLKTAVCYGSAACITEGTNPPRKQDVEALLKIVEIKHI